MITMKRRVKSETMEVAKKTWLLQEVTYLEVVTVINDTLDEQFDGDEALVIKSAYDRGFANACKLIKAKLSLQALERSGVINDE